MPFGFDPLQWLADRITELIQGLTGPVQPLFNLVSNTPLEFTTRNPIVMQAWTSMVTAADILLGLFVVIGAIQMMYGQQTGSLYMPMGQFLSKAILTAILMHLSFLIGEDLLLLNNQLCNLVQANLQTFVQTVNHGQLFDNKQLLLLSLSLTIVFGIGIFRVLFQAVKRLIRFNMLFVLSGPAFLTSFHPYTASIFSTWVRMYVITIFEQFVQYLTFGLGMQFMIATKQTGLTGFILATAMVNMTAEIPALLTRFGAAATGSSNHAGIGTLVKTATSVAVLFA